MDSSFEELGEMLGNPYLCPRPNKSLVWPHNPETAGARGQGATVEVCGGPT